MIQIERVIRLRWFISDGIVHLRRRNSSLLPIRSLSSFQHLATSYHIAVYSVSVLDNTHCIFLGRG
jgi:hypothetical protein